MSDSKERFRALADRMEKVLNQKSDADLIEVSQVMQSSLDAREKFIYVQTYMGLPRQVIEGMLQVMSADELETAVANLQERIAPTNTSQMLQNAAAAMDSRENFHKAMINANSTLVSSTKQSEVWKLYNGRTLVVPYHNDVPNKQLLGKNMLGAGVLRGNRSIATGYVSSSIDNIHNKTFEAAETEFAKHGDLRYERKGDSFALFSSARPEYRETFPLSNNMEHHAVSPYIDKKIKVFRQRLNEYAQRTEDLSRDYGFVAQHADHLFAFEHPDLKLALEIDTEKNPLSEKTALMRLEKLRAQLEELQADRLKQLYALKKQHFSIEYEPSPATGELQLVVSHPDKAWGRQTAPVFGEKSILGREAKELLALSKLTLPELKVPAEPLPAPATPAPVEVKPVEAPAAPARVFAPEEKIDIVFDSSTLIHLATSRTGGKQWLDLIHAISLLPNIGHIIIPSIVADWELRGKIPYIDETGHHMVSLDRNIQQLSDFRACDTFINNATRWSYDAKGERRIIPGKDDKIVVYESPDQLAFLNDLRERAEEWKAAGILPAQLRLFRESSAKDMGERACRAYCRSPECLGAAILVNNDFIFSNGHYAASKKRKRSEDTYTSHKRGIGTATTAGLVEAVCEAFKERFPSVMRHISGVGEKDASPERILQQIAVNREAGYDPSSSFSDEFPGRKLNGQKEATLKSVLCEGVKAMPEESLPVLGSHTADAGLKSASPKKKTDSFQ